MENIFYLEKSSSGIAQITLKSKLFEKRILLLDNQVDSGSVTSLIAQIAILATDDSTKPITLLINSPGGSIQDGLVLIDVMRSCGCVINTVSLGMAASMGAVILSSGTKGHRYISKSSQVMVHKPLLHKGLPKGDCDEIETTAKRLLERKNQLNTLLAENTGKPIEVIEELTAKDTYLTASEALEYGLVDEIADNMLLQKIITGGLI